MTVRVGINGFGRIGRNFFRAAKAQGADIDFVAVNDLGSLDQMAHLLQYDSVLGRFPDTVKVVKGGIKVGDDVLKVLSERNPGDLPWGELGVDVVIESTGFFNSRDAASAHLDAGAPLVIVSAPCSEADATFVYGVNHKDFRISQHKVISNASCTTNCIVPLVKVLDDAFGVDQGMITTIHAYTGTQNLIDAPHKDLRRARAAAENLIPTSTGAAKATGKVLPHLLGKLDGMAVRVPLAAGSAADFVGMLKTEASIDEINEAFRMAASGPMAGILAFSDEPLVSSDIVGRPESCIYDSGMTMAMGKMVKKCEPARDVCRVVIWKTDWCRAHAYGLCHSEGLTYEDFGHDDVLVTRRVMLPNPEFRKSQFLAPNYQFQIFIKTLFGRLTRIMDRHQKHTVVDHAASLQ